LVASSDLSRSRLLARALRRLRPVHERLGAIVPVVPADVLASTPRWTRRQEDRWPVGTVDNAAELEDNEPGTDTALRRASRLGTGRSL